MKKLLFILSILFSFGVHAQTFTPIHNYQAPDGLDVVKFLGIPYGATPSLNGINRPNGHPLFYNTTDSSLYLYSGNQWIIVGGGNSSAKDTVNVGYGLNVTWDSTGHQLLFADHPDGYEGGIVTYAGTGFDFNVSAITLYLHNNTYQFPATTLTLSAPNSEPRYDIFGVDSSGAFVKMGDSATLPIEPQVGIDSFALTKAFLISPGDTVPSGIDVISVYDETGTTPEFTASTSGTITKDLVNTDNPYHLSKAIYVSKYSNNSRFDFLSASQITIDDGQVITGYIYINDTISSLNFRLYNSSTAVTNNIKITDGYGINTGLLNQYQKFSIPLSAFSKSSASFNTIRLTNSGNDNSGAGGYYLDYLQFQTGINNLPEVTDYSNKQDSSTVVKTTIGSDTANVINDWVKGIAYPRKDTIWTGGSGVGGSVISVTGNPTELVDNADPTNPIIQQDALKLNISDTSSMLSPYVRTGIYEKQTATSGQTDFDFTLIPADNTKVSFFLNSMFLSPSYYTVSGNTLTMTLGLVTGDVLEERGVQ